jgi:hypothetical protein
MANDLTIKVSESDGPVTVDSLSATITQMMTALQGIDAEGSWEVISLTMHSPLKLVVRKPPADARVLSHFGLISAANSKRPLAFPVTAGDAVAVQAFREVLGNGFGSVKLFYNGKTVTITPETAKKVSAAIRSAAGGFSEWTTVRGVLDQVTASTDSRRFRLIESVTGRAVQCTFDDLILEEVKTALPSRVEVFGKAQYGPDRKIVAIAVKSFRALQSGIKISELAPVDITGGIDSADFVRRVRSGG